MIHYLPTVRSRKDGFDHLAELAAETKEMFNSVLQLDFSQCGFFEANMTAPLAAVLTKLSVERFNRIEIVNIPPAIKNILCKNRFLVFYGYDPINDVNQTVLPLIRLQLKDGNRFADYLNEHMNGKGIPPMTKAMDKMFRGSVFEVFQNAVLHSDSEPGVFICGQFYPQKHRLDLTITDAGIGVRTNVRRYLKNDNLSSVSAIKWVLHEGHTTKTGRQPGGMGLKFLKEFVKLNGGMIQLVSRFGFYEYNKDNSGFESFSKLTADLTGTTVNLEINTSDTCTYQLSSEISPKDIF